MSFNRKTWTEKGSADNAVAVASRAAESGRKHYITAITGSYDNSKSGVLSVKDGSDIIYEVRVYDSDHIEFPFPIPATKGNAVSVELAESGAGGNIGRVNIQGFTK